MQFNVASLLQEQYGATREYDIDDDVVIDGATQHLIGRLRLDRTPRGILARVRLRGTMHADCSRCLTPTAAPVELMIDEEFIPTLDINSGGRIEPTETEVENYRVNRRHILDLTEAVRQYWAIVLPMAPLCSEECCGLCPHCGADLNEGEHQCPHDDEESPWAALLALKLN